MTELELKLVKLSEGKSLEFANEYFALIPQIIHVVKANLNAEWINVEDEMPKAGSVVLARYVGGSLNGIVEVIHITGKEDPKTVFFGQWFPLPGEAK